MCRPVQASGWSPLKRRGRRAEESQTGQESRQTFLLLDFDIWHFATRLFRRAESCGRGHQNCATWGIFATPTTFPIRDAASTDELEAEGLADVIGQDTAAGILPVAEK